MKIVFIGLVFLTLLLTACTKSHETDAPRVIQDTQEIIILDGETFQLSANIQEATINGIKIKQFLYNDQFPGPRLRLTKGSTIYVNFTNNLKEPTTIHWHGIRLDNPNDGLPGVTQPPIDPGKSHLYTLHVPDAGIFWYHPHIREDKQQELGLYGNIIVEEQNRSIPINREEFIILDDILLTPTGVYPYGNDQITHALMGRFGNIMLLNGKEQYDLKVRKGEIVRFYFTNAANVRPFRLEIPGVKLKLIASDLSHYEQEQFTDAVIISPGERYVINAYFDKPGDFVLKNTNSIASTVLGIIKVNDDHAENDFSEEFNTMHVDDVVTQEVSSLKSYFNKTIDVNLLLTAEFGHMMGGMHHHGEDGIEWEDEMPDMNQMMGSNMVKWQIVDQETKKADRVFHWKVGDKIKMRITNDHNSPHAMQHPFHLHGQRFLVLAVNGKKTTNFAWKDTVLIPADSKVDLLVDIANPGTWMIHCHIAEHLHTGMMMMFDVADYSKSL